MLKRYDELEEGDVIKYRLGVSPKAKYKAEFDHWEERDWNSVIIYIRLTDTDLLGLVYLKKEKVEVEKNEQSNIDGTIN